jgi:hypothetical protein
VKLGYAELQLCSRRGFTAFPCEHYKSSVVALADVQNIFQQLPVSFLHDCVSFTPPALTELPAMLAPEYSADWHVSLTGDSDTYRSVPHLAHPCTHPHTNVRLHAAASQTFYQRIVLLTGSELELSMWTAVALMLRACHRHHICLVLLLWHSGGSWLESCVQKGHLLEWMHPQTRWPVKETHALQREQPSWRHQVYSRATPSAPRSCLVKARNPGTRANPGKGS